MHIGLLAYGLDRPLTGISRYTCELVRAIQTMENRPDLALMAAGGLGLLGSSNGYTLVGLSGSRRLPALMTLGNLEIRRHSQNLGLDLIHDPTGVMPLLFACKNMKLVVTLHDVFAWSLPGHSTFLDTMIYKHWLPRLAPRADALITDSHASCHDIVQHLPVQPEKITVIPIGANRHYQQLDQDEIRSALKLHSVEQPFILYVGSIAARKNLPRLLEAYARLRKWSPKWRLVIVGARGWQASPVFETVERLSLEQHVQFTGYVEEEDLPALYNAADLFVFPSLYEGFGLPVLEAMACGTPVVTSNSSSLPEVAGSAALLVDPYDVEAIAAAMRRLLEDPDLAAELRARGLERAKQFTWERTARETIAVYERVLDQN